MQIRCNERSLCGGGGGGSSGGGGWGCSLRNFKWGKGRWRKKVRHRQPRHTAELKN